MMQQRDSRQRPPRITPATWPAHTWTLTALRIVCSPIRKYTRMYLGGYDVRTTERHDI